VQRTILSLQHTILPEHMLWAPTLSDHSTGMV